MSEDTKDNISNPKREPRVLGPIFVFGTIIFWFVVFVMGEIDFDPLTKDFKTDPWSKKACDRIERSAVVSADGSRKAAIVDFVCGGSGRTGAWTAVSLVNIGKEPIASDAVFVGDRRYDENRIRLEWMGPKSLKITVPNDAVVIDHKLIHWGARTEISFDPDDPVVR